MKKVALHTLGCKLNYAETSTIGRQFIDRGFEVVESDQPCDVYILNTCSVTERADRDCRYLIRRALRQSPGAFVIVTGCYAQLQPETIASIDGVDLVVGAKEKFRLFDHAVHFEKRSAAQMFVSCIDESTEFESAHSADVGGRTRAFLKVQDGCDFHCTFCTIPLARGASRSTDIPFIVRQAVSLVEQGYKEIVLTGVNVGDFGKKIGSNLMELMWALEEVDGLHRIRVSSIEPNLLTREMIKFMLQSEKFCNHFHIPLQSGSDTILRRMRRRYRASEYQEIIEYIRTSDPDAAIGADVIVGFPGETDELFEETCRFIADLPVSYLHVFTYSERPGTPAELFDGPIEPRLRFKRNELLRILGDKKREAFHSSFIERECSVLIESAVPGGKVSGLTSNYIRVEAPAQPSLINTFRRVKITGISNDVCSGKIVENVEPIENKDVLFLEAQLPTACYQ